jgi:putative ABC transport system permease protein
MSLLRNLGRRKLRTTLTVLGIVIGIWALVVFSAMANKINTLVATGSDYYVGKIVVSDGSTSGLGIGIVPIDVGLADRIRNLAGVAAVSPQVELPFADVKPSGFGIPKLILGAVAGADGGLDKATFHAGLGRLLTPADEGSLVTVLGSDIARQLGSAVGETIDIRGTPFQVVGILEPTLSAPDTTAMVPSLQASNCSSPPSRRRSARPFMRAGSHRRLSCTRPQGPMPTSSPAASRASAT